MDPNGQYRRDPVSLLMDKPARQLLQRAYAAPGKWHATRLRQPLPAHVAWAAGLGINLLGRDPAKEAVGTRMRRWLAAFERAAYYNHKWYFTGGRLDTDRRQTAARTRALDIEFGRWLPARGVIPAGWAVRIRLRPGGTAARKAVMKLPESQRIFTDEGAAAGKWGDPTKRDWA